ncbi:hypothetical protein HMPREF0326_02886 [Desulfovibrio sp. 3_1_syn3]|uniref:glycosyltransferase n=1 Tax=Desulfovibrio sp. 3_1_syn3 TaxID=457398 RepID=UPI0001E12C59|nr:glycosyltransferase [Desulfovibrio sp. 3_1_syn3]EFL84527.1 hypothetical protein HMPREF0326_02886 [Desulfovibrio sp. 3_1_syn3]
MIRCLILMHSVGGGAEKITLDLARCLDPQRFQVTLGCMRHLSVLAAGVPAGLLFHMPERPSLMAALHNVARVWRLARDSDVVLGSLELQSIFWAALLAPGRSVAWLHKDVEGYLNQRRKGYAWLYRAILGWALRRCRTIICVSRGILKSSERLWPDLRPRMRVLWNPVDTASIRRYALAPLPKVLEPCFHKPVILGVGRLEKQKSFDLLIQAHALLLQRGIEHHLCILGEGSQRTYLEDTAQYYGVSDSTFLPGFMDPYPIMAHASLLAVSSSFEGFSLVLVEALCLGLTVVSTDCPSGPSEVLEEGKYGALIPVGDVAALVDALQAVLLQPPDVVARAAGQRRAEDFTPDRTIGVWQDVLAEAASRDEDWP